MGQPRQAYIQLYSVMSNSSWRPIYEHTARARMYMRTHVIGNHTRRPEQVSTPSEEPRTRSPSQHANVEANGATGGKPHCHNYRHSAANRRQPHMVFYRIVGEAVGQASNKKLMHWTSIDQYQ